MAGRVPVNVAPVEILGTQRRLQINHVDGQVLAQLLQASGEVSVAGGDVLLPRNRHKHESLACRDLPDKIFEQLPLDILWHRSLPPFDVLLRLAVGPGSQAPRLNKVGRQTVAVQPRRTGNPRQQRQERPPIERMDLAGLIDIRARPDGCIKGHHVVSRIVHVYHQHA